MSLVAVVALFLPLSASGEAPQLADVVVEASHATIEARDGQRLRVLFGNEGQPELVLRPASGAWDWSATSKLVIAVENPGDQPLTLLLRVDSGADRSLRGKLAIAPHEAGELAVWLDAPAPRAMGMVAGAAAPGSDTMPVTAIEGSVDPARVSAVHLGLARPSRPQPLFVGPMHIEPPTDADKHAYDGIVDGFGQYAGGDWPEKVGSVAMLRARAAEEERQLAGWLAEMPKRDRYGGLDTGGSFGTSSFFRTERRAGRWWLVTPDGNPFFSIGMDVVAPSGVTYVEGREFMFCDLPARDGEFAVHWSERDDRRGLGAQRGRAFDHGAAFNFYTANLERKFGADWRARWREEALTRLQAWGFNTIGDWSEPELCAMHRLPYTVPLYPEGKYATVSSGEDWWGPVPDPFDPAFAEAVDRMAEHTAAQFRGDPYLIGYFVGNELAWGRGSAANPREYYALVLNTLAAGPESPAKGALVRDLVERYRDPQRLAETWGIPLASWGDLSRAGYNLPLGSLDNPKVLADLAAFARRFAEAYFRTVAETLRRHDPDHLYLGSRFAWQTREAVEACARWCDVVSFNRYRRSLAADDEWARLHALGKPVLIGEFHFGSADRGLFWEGLAGVSREEERGPAYARYLYSVVDNPDMVGAHWFQYVDEPLTGRTLDGENAHIGFVSVADLSYEGLAAAAHDANLAVLDRLHHALHR